MSSPTRRLISSSRRSSGTPAAVAITPPSSARRREPEHSITPYPVLAVPGSIPRTIIEHTFCVRVRTPPARGRPPRTYAHARVHLPSAKHEPYSRYVAELPIRPLDVRQRTARGAAPRAELAARPGRGARGREGQGAAARQRHRDSQHARIPRPALGGGRSREALPADAV